MAAIRTARRPSRSRTRSSIRPPLARMLADVEETGAGVTCRRRLTWAQTDAAGHNHFSALFAWAEEAEHALWRALGQANLVPSLPRVRVEAEYHERLSPGAEVEVVLEVLAVGRTSCTFGTRVLAGGRTVQRARHTVVHAPERPLPWPQDVRAALLAPRRYREGATASTVGGHS